MKVVLYSCVVALVVLAGTSVRALEPFARYDDFSSTTIDPVQWSGFEAGGGTEAIRGLDSALGELRMSHRAFGNTASNDGRTVSGLGVALLKNTAAITAVQAQVTALAAQVGQCPDNTTPTAGRAGVLYGAFFNTDTPTPGSAVNDVRAALFLSRGPTDPSDVLHVWAQVFRCTNESCSQIDSFQQSELGTVTLGQQVQLQLEWDKPNQQFLFRREAQPKVAISYAPLADTAAPGKEFKDLAVVSLVDNCMTTPRPVSFVDAAFANVKVNQSAAP